MKREGILLIDKPAGITSYDVVEYLKKRLRIKKIGHAGTLDPMATGLLIILIGSYTKCFEKFAGFDKEYEATLTLGITTDTGDSQGAIIRCNKIPEIAIPYTNLSGTLVVLRSHIPATKLPINAIAM